MRLQLRGGRTYSALSKYELALLHILKSLELSEQQGDNEAHARMRSLAMLSRLYTDMKNPEKALKAAEAALAEDIARNPSRPVASLTFTRAVALNAMGRTDDALQGLKKALRMAMLDETFCRPDGSACSSRAG